MSRLERITPFEVTPVVRRIFEDNSIEVTSVEAELLDEAHRLHRKIRG